MSATKHTPGPWAYNRWDQLGDTRFYVAQAEGAQYTPNYSDVATLIAETVSSEYVRIQEANARLIAAAPELLEALRSLVDRDFTFMSGKAIGSSRKMTWDEVRAARAAIAKATESEV